MSKAGTLLAVCLLITLRWSSAAEQAQKRFSVDDLFELEDVGSYFGGPVAYSDDGEKLAFTRLRPKSTAVNRVWDGLRGNDRGDVWVQLDEHTPINITHGLEDGSGWWSPQWSPDGSKLALLSTRGGNVRLWIWDSTTRLLRPITASGLSFTAPGQPYTWVSNTHLLFSSLPGDERARFLEREFLTPALANEGWSKARDGVESTASVLRSGVHRAAVDRRSGERLVLVDTTGVEKTIAEGSTPFWQLSPDNKAVAFARRLAFAPLTDEPLPLAFPGAWTIEVVTLDGRSVVSREHISRDVVEQSMRWSPDGSEVAFLSYGATGKEAPVLNRLNLRSGQVISRVLTHLSSASFARGASVQLEWTADSDVLLLAAERDSAGKRDNGHRLDYWLVRAGGEHHAVTRSMRIVPLEIWPQDGRRRFFGLAEGDVWSLEPARLGVENLTASFAPAVDRLSWPVRMRSGLEERPRRGRTYSRAILASGSANNSLRQEILDLRSGGLRPLRSPAPGAELIAFAPDGGTGVFYANTRDGLQLWKCDSASSATAVLIAGNQFLRHRVEAPASLIDYVSLDGEKLQAWLILPVDYRPGERYPLLTWVYAGWMADSHQSRHWSIASPDLFNPQIPAAKGYAVLMPSMPLAPEGAVDDPMLRLLNGVLPAVDRVVGLGIANDEQVFVMGHSFGGFSTYGIIAQTRRFRAAVSVAGPANLISLYGAFDATLRYTENPHESLIPASQAESGQFRMGGPPWKDLGRYIRNSPIFYVDRVETPLMIIQGDLDFVSIQQGEEFFVSLTRLGKPAEFVRYWGEGHSLESPANIRDMWCRIFAWFESHAVPQVESVNDTPDDPLRPRAVSHHVEPAPPD